MRRAGVRHVAIGFESPIDEELQAMNKHIHSEDMLSLVQVFRRLGFWVHGMFIFGYPAGTDSGFVMSVEERVKRFRRFIRRAGIDSVQVLLPVPLPGTELRQRLERQNRIYPLQEVGWEYYDGTFPLFEPDLPLTAEDLQRAGRRIMSRFYRFAMSFCRREYPIISNVDLFTPSLAAGANGIGGGRPGWFVLAAGSRSGNGRRISRKAISCRGCKGQGGG
jgi:radical SAM superfamily enzyme YgiQ (UPF0313 family)